MAARQSAYRKRSAIACRACPSFGSPISWPTPNQHDGFSLALLGFLGASAQVRDQLAREDGGAQDEAQGTPLPRERMEAVAAPKRPLAGEAATHVTTISRLSNRTVVARTTLLIVLSTAPPFRLRRAQAGYSRPGRCLAG